MFITGLDSLSTMPTEKPEKRRCPCSSKWLHRVERSDVRKKETRSLADIPAQLEEAHLRAARLTTDPALGGVYFVVCELLTISKLGAKVNRQEIPAVVGVGTRSNR